MTFRLDDEGTHFIPFQVFFYTRCDRNADDLKKKTQNNWKEVQPAFVYLRIHVKMCGGTQRWFSFTIPTGDIKNVLG